MNDGRAESASLSRHKRDCPICRHERREEIESEFVSWGSPGRIAVEYGLGNRAAVYRHAQALALIEERRHNLRACLERIVERSEEADFTASALVGAVHTLARINARGEWVDLAEQHKRESLFDRMSREELETYAREGVLPAWYQAGTD